LPNLSKKIRWSLDLRWQKASEAIGYYGLKEGVRMRSSTDPNVKIDWESFDAVDRHDPNAAVLLAECFLVRSRLFSALTLLVGDEKCIPL